MAAAPFTRELARAALVEAIVGLDADYDEERAVHLNIGGALVSAPAPIRIEVEDAVDGGRVLFDVHVQEVAP